MPANLFDPPSRPAPAGGARRLTVTTSIVIHAAIVLLIIVLPLIGGVSMPSAMQRIDAFIAPALIEIPPPPAAAPPPSSAEPVNAPNLDAAPTTAPETIAPEVTTTPIPAGIPTAPGGLPYVPGTGVPGGLPGLPPEPAPRPEPKPAGPVRVGGVITPPKRLTGAPPAYPKIAEAARVEGTVILEAIINEAGVVTNLKVLKSIPLLDEAAKEAVSRWRYSPTTLNGLKVPVIMTVTVTFTLK